MLLIPGIHTTELELITKNPLGFDVTVQYAPGRFGGARVIFHNCHEIHYLFNLAPERNMKGWNSMECAIESKHHQTGSCLRLFEDEDQPSIMYIQIEAAIKLHSFH